LSRLRPWQRPDVLLAAIIVGVLLAFAFTVDPVHNSYGLKSDEATYTAAAFSMAYDGDLVFERKDLERFWAIYTCGPDGMFLQKPRGFYKVTARPPFVRFVTWNDPPSDRLYFGKSYIYPVLSAPFVKLFGLRGMLVFNVLLLAGAGWCGYQFLYARSGARAASFAVVTAFLGISIVPVYVVWYTPEIFNLSLAFYAYFLWLYKEVTAPPEWTPAIGWRSWPARFLYGRGSDLAAAALFGVLIFSKPLYGLLPGPVFAWLLLKKRFRDAEAFLVVTGLAAALLFGINAAISGEVSYQGGNRRQYYPSHMAFENPKVGFEAGFPNATNELHSDVFDENSFVYRLCLNAGYFVAGRHAGLLPYFFPGVAAVLLWLVRWRWIRGWQFLTLLAVLGTIGAMLVILPFTWSGGGGPPGNRYFMGVYPALFFLMPPLESLVVPLLVWLGGAVFTAQLVLNPYYTAKYPYWNVDHGAVRLLPIELTMVRDLPIMLDRDRAPANFQNDQQIELYLLDKNAYAPEPAGLWFKGGRRADVIVRVPKPIATLRLTLMSPIPNHARVSFDGRAADVDLKAGQAVEVVIPSSGGVYSLRGYNYVLTVAPDNGFVPRLVETGSTDKRFLGALVRLKAEFTK
jgi:hypothetical protein